VKFTVATFENVEYCNEPVKPVTLSVAQLSTVISLYVQAHPYVTVNVAQSTIQFVNLVEPQSKFDTSVHAVHLTTLPLLSLNS
jgi:hypothetical protein